MNVKDLIGFIRTKADEYGLDADMCEAIAIVESSLNPHVTRFEPGYKWLYKPDIYAIRLRQTNTTEVVHQSMSYGPMQLMGAVARELGYADYLLKLCADVFTCVDLSMKHLKGYDKKYENELSVIAAWNAGSAKKIDIGQGKGITYVNQAYVDKVSAELRRLRNS